MSKLIATYAAGMLAVFTETHGDLRQRALLDIGDTVPTPDQMAKLAGSLSDQWGWGNAISKAAKPKAVGMGRPQGGHHADDVPGPERKKLIAEYLKDHPDSMVREIVEGCGFEPTPGRNSRWAAMVGGMVVAGVLVDRLVVGGHPTIPGLNRYKLYSLAEPSD